MQGNTPIRRCKPLPLNASLPCVSVNENGFIPVKAMPKRQDACDNMVFADNCEWNNCERNNCECNACEWNGRERDNCERNSCECNACEWNGRERDNCERNSCECNAWEWNGRERDNCERNSCDRNGRDRNGCEKDCSWENYGSLKAEMASECRQGRSSAMVYAQEHVLESMFSIEEAIEQGTLFKELFKPMAKNCGCGGEEPSPMQRLAFAAWELRLYLDTHPDCKKAKRLYEELEKLLGCPNYATTFVPDGANCSGEDWVWTKNPWPWENHAVMGRR